ncbi:EXOC6 [Lepeophtheirus salmonis]|uniref:EXOC6 n=1 Tax=Lepeophtheirus salmonis TaxID=72036 RepID=A0A7R8HEB8_LEPSM|nr:EXOC6 [Lepeophtheirus salmonis]CAF3039011.1 EXOC6 [Lepeophtheirus salmonis]
MADRTRKGVEGAGDAIESVQIDGLVVMKLIKHCHEVDAANQGVAPRGSFGTDGVDDEDFQLAIMRKLRLVNVDHMHTTVEESVCLIFDTAKTSKGFLSLKAFRLTPSAVALYKSGDFSPESVRNLKVCHDAIFQEVPIHVKNSHLVNELLLELSEAIPVETGSQFLDLGTASVLEYQLKQLMDNVDELNQESVKFIKHQNMAIKQCHDKVRWHQKRQQENSARQASFGGRSMEKSGMSLEGLKVPGSSSSEHELYLQEIEAVDDYWGPTFRAIYETDQHEAFIQKLEERIRDHDSDIQKMCNFHYQGFIFSVRDLFQVRSDVEQLNEDVVAVDKDLRGSSEKVIEKAESLMFARRVEKNIVLTIESLSSCLPVLQTFSKLSKQMAEKRFHPALKTLEQLEHTFLPRIANYRFSKQMRASIPKLRESIKSASITELKDFLENVRKLSPKIGDIALRQTAHKLNINPVQVLGPYTGQAFLDDEDITAEDLVDFGPLYRCLHINTPPINMHESLEGYRSYFHGIVGFFFVCEDHVLNTGNGLVSKAYLDEVWSSASVKIMSTFQAHAAYLTEAEFMLKIKNIMLLFASSLVAFGYSVDKLFMLLQELFDHYTEILMKKCVVIFREIFDSDNYHPIEVSCHEEYDEIVSAFQFESETLEEEPFPKSFPFSAMVPKVYNEVKHFIDSCVKFTQDLNLNPSEIDESLRKSTNILLTRTLSGCLSSLVRKNNINLLQLIQININTYHLESTNVHLERYISEITRISMEATHIARLQGRSMFKDIRAEAEDQINLKLISKMDEFIELANYDWLLSEAHGVSSPWLMDLIAFLKSVFQSFTNLPEKLAQMSCMSACQHLAKSIMEMILDESVKSISLGRCSHYGTGNDRAKYLRVKPKHALIIFDKLKEGEKKSSFSISMNKKDRDKKKLMDTIYKQLKALSGEEKGLGGGILSGGGDLLVEKIKEECDVIKNWASFKRVLSFTTSY